MSIIVLGTVALDTVKTPAGLRTRMLGGSAVHFSMSARIFTGVHLVAVVGKDFPGQHSRFLRDKGVCLDSLAVSAGKTFHWAGEYRGDMNCAQTKKTELGVLAGFCPAVSPRQRSIRNVFLANVDPQLQEEFLSCMRSPRLVGLDSMNYWIHTKRKALIRVLKKVDIFVANDQEARDLSGETNLLKAAVCLASYGPQLVLIKKGEHGVFLYGKRTVLSLPAFPLTDVLDPTGAGDTFAGGFMGYLATRPDLSRKNLAKAIAYGTVAASFNVQGFGVERTSRLCRADLEKRMAEFKEIVAI